MRNESIYLSLNTVSAMFTVESVFTNIVKFANIRKIWQRIVKISRKLSTLFYINFYE